MSKIFISYRREDTAGHARLVFKSLTERFGNDRVFMDISSLRPGEDFGKAIEDSISQCEVFILIIGKRWLTRDSSGRLRLENADDFVRREIVAALSREILVIPTLVDGATMPQADELPTPLRPLVQRHAISLHSDRPPASEIFELIEHLERHFRENAPRVFAMECPRCRKMLEISTSQMYAECASCGAYLATLRPGTEIVSVADHDPKTRQEILRKLRLASIDLENRNYKEALKAYEGILGEFPDTWEAILNKSICIFWLGREDLAHLETVVGLLTKAEALSGGHPRVDAFRETIAYNLAMIGAAEERLGEKIGWTLAVFEISKKIFPDHEQRDQIIKHYCQSCFSEIQARLIEMLGKQGKHFDPPLTELITINSLNKLSPTLEQMKFFGMMAEHKIEANRNHGDLPHALNETKRRLKELAGHAIFPRIVFPRFGRPRIE